MSTKYFREIIDELNDWAELNSIGRATVYRDHRGYCAIGAESVVKLREMPPEDQATIKALITKYKALKFNVICSASGEPDRVEVYRQLL
jgi:hypothetical protein